VQSSHRVTAVDEHHALQRRQVIGELAVENSLHLRAQVVVQQRARLVRRIPFGSTLKGTNPAARSRGSGVYEQQ